MLFRSNTKQSIFVLLQFVKENEALCYSLIKNPTLNFLGSLLQVAFAANVSLSCDQVGKPLRRTLSAGFRQCVYNPLPGRPAYWLSGATPTCPRIDCGVPPAIPGTCHFKLFFFYFLIELTGLFRVCLILSPKYVF